MVFRAGNPKEYERATINPKTAADIVFIWPLVFIAFESKKSSATATVTAIIEIIIEVGQNEIAETPVRMTRAAKV